MTRSHRGSSSIALSPDRPWTPFKTPPPSSALARRRCFLGQIDLQGAAVRESLPPVWPLDRIPAIEQSAQSANQTQPGHEPEDRRSSHASSFQLYRIPRPPVS